MAEREAFIGQLGEPVFIEDFGLDRIAFFILADGTECELVFGREGALEEVDVGPFKTSSTSTPSWPARSSRSHRPIPTNCANSSARS